MTGAVPRLWQGETVAILAGGPSLRTQGLGPLYASGGRVKLISVNDSWRLLPSFEIATSKVFGCGQCNGRKNPECAFCYGTNQVSSCAMYFCDEQWWRRQLDTNPRTRDNMYSFHDVMYKGWWWSGAPGFAAHPQVNALRLTNQTNLECAPTALCHGSNGGYQAINLAFHFGAKRIILLGYDMKVDGARTHWHDEPRPDGFKDVLAQSMLPHFESLVKPLRSRGVKVVNCTPGSALTCFPMKTLDDTLRDT